MPRTIDNAPWLPLHALGTGLAEVPPDDLPELSRGLPDYEQRDPAELAAMRTRMGVIPQQGRPDITPEHAATALTTLGSAYLAPETAIARGVMALPRAAGVALGSLGAGLFGTEAANADEKKTPTEIKAEQRILKANNFYDGPIDGNEGEKTLAARALAKQAADKAAADADAAKEKTAGETRAAELERVRLENEASGNAATTLKEQNEATRLTQLGEGNARLRDVEAATPVWQKAMREYGPPMGYVVGGAAGAGVRRGVYKRATNAYEDRAAKAEALFAEDLGTNKAATPARVGRVNQFYREGGGKEPYTITPDQAPGFKFNPDAPAASALYGPNTRSAVLSNLGANALAGAEMGYAEHAYSGAKDELASAQKAVGENSNEANIQRLQAAANNAAWFDFLRTAGRGLGIYFNGESAIKRAQNVKPNAAAADAERIELDALARTPPTPSRTRSSKTAAPAPASVDPAIAAADTARRESRKFSDQGESLGDILTRAAQSMRKDPRFMPPDL